MSSTVSARRKKTAGGPKSASSSIAELPVDLIAVVQNDREHIEPDELQRLADSIKRVGIIQPLAVAADGDGWRLIAGERRLRAAKLAGLKTVPATVRGDVLLGSIDDASIAEHRLAENIHRVDLNTVEKARAIQQLIKQHGRPQKELARELGWSPSALSNVLRLLQLPDCPWLQWIAAGKIAPSSARLLLPYLKRPQVLQWIVDKYSAEIDQGEFTLHEYSIREAVMACTRPLDKAHFYEGLAPSAGQCHFTFRPSDKDAVKALDAEKMPGAFGERWRAWNVDEFKERNAKPLKTRRAKHSAHKAKVAETRSQTRKKEAAAGPQLDEGNLRWELEKWLAGRMGEHIVNADPKRPLAQLLIPWALAAADWTKPNPDGLPSPYENGYLMALVESLAAEEWEQRARVALSDLLLESAAGNSECAFGSLEGVLAAGRFVGIDWRGEYKLTDAQLCCWNDAARAELAMSLPEETLSTMSVAARAGNVTSLAEEWPARLIPAEVERIMAAAEQNLEAVQPAPKRKRRARKRKPAGQ